MDRNVARNPCRKSIDLGHQASGRAVRPFSRLCPTRAAWRSSVERSATNGRRTQLIPLTLRRVLEQAEALKILWGMKAEVVGL